MGAAVVGRRGGLPCSEQSSSLGTAWGPHVQRREQQLADTQVESAAQLGDAQAQSSTAWGPQACRSGGGRRAPQTAAAASGAGGWECPQCCRQGWSCALRRPSCDAGAGEDRRHGRLQRRRQAVGGRGGSRLPRGVSRGCSVRLDDPGVPGELGGAVRGFPRLTRDLKRAARQPQLSAMRCEGTAQSVVEQHGSDRPCCRAAAATRAAAGGGERGAIFTRASTLASAWTC